MAVTQQLLLDCWKGATEQETKRVILHLLRAGLTGQAKEVYDYICAYPGSTSMDVALMLAKPANHTDNILRRLLDWHLVRREAQGTREGLHYRWWKEVAE